MAACSDVSSIPFLLVSTHSRPKVAACGQLIMATKAWCFNTQPPEGGCDLVVSRYDLTEQVSTHSRPKVAAKDHLQMYVTDRVSTHSRPKVAANTRYGMGKRLQVSTHSRPKVAASFIVRKCGYFFKFQHTAARRWLLLPYGYLQLLLLFQHTAARRWLPIFQPSPHQTKNVSTHSRPKVAAPYIKKQEKSAN